MTYIATNEGWLYLAVVIDFFNRCVVGWAMDEHPTAQLAVAALKMAYLRRRKPEHLIHHSDRGSQYASHHFRKSLKEMHFRQSMSRKGCCYDNAMVEAFPRFCGYELIMRLSLRSYERGAR